MTSESNVDVEIAAIARRLAEALADAGYTRKQEDKKRVAELQHELVTTVNRERVG